MTNLISAMVTCIHQRESADVFVRRPTASESASFPRNASATPRASAIVPPRRFATAHLCSNDGGAVASGLGCEHALRLRATVPPTKEFKNGGPGQAERRYISLAP
jgi:hypothetical protein